VKLYQANDVFSLCTLYHGQTIQADGFHPKNDQVSDALKHYVQGAAS
jgi:hypothetical protein